MIVVAIIGILAAIAIPNFIRYQLRSKTSEARTNIGAIRTAQESFHGSEDDFIGGGGGAIMDPGAVPGPTKAPWVGAACMADCGRGAANIVNCDQFDCIGYRPDGEVYYQYQTDSMFAGPGTPGEFCVAALGDLDGDGMNAGFEWQSSIGVAAMGVGQFDCALVGNGRCGMAGLVGGELTDCSVGLY